MNVDESAAQGLFVAIVDGDASMQTRHAGYSVSNWLFRVFEMLGPRPFKIGSSQLEQSDDLISKSHRTICDRRKLVPIHLSTTGEAPIFRRS
jgi:hypothetical protein